MINSLIMLLLVSCLVIKFVHKPEYLSAPSCLEGRLIIKFPV
ncbi:hypothetical protein BTN50_1127 [Candidatus Enterovibrio altilux]|uniref:Uncharacterized protein n=1 Tax=Candidatus Enterovibrio altilux TaxID=1927128 RepID=A0A291B9E6_9GAMM|nr:hypothetical protein BTN50_1127 [Candidatus Enterovibrio luxaltus]